MSVDAIIGCLLSGREPEELVEAAERSKGAKRPATEMDSLRAVDADNYLLYRTRRFGRALATLGERVVRTVRSTEATRYRLKQDPLGPWALAEALVREWKVPDGADRSAVVFALAELALMLAHVNRRAHAERDSTDPDLRLLYAEFLSELAALRRGTIIGWQPPTSLKGYADAVDLECSRLLGMRAGGADAR